MQKIAIKILIYVTIFVTGMYTPPLEEWAKLLKPKPGVYKLSFEVYVGTVKNGWFVDKTMHFTLTNSFVFMNRMQTISNYDKDRSLNDYSIELRYKLISEDLTARRGLVISGDIDDKITNYANWMERTDGHESSPWFRYDQMNDHPDNMEGTKVYISKVVIYKWKDNHGSGRQMNYLLQYDESDDTWYWVGGQH